MFRKVCIVAMLSLLPCLTFAAASGGAASSVFDFNAVQQGAGSQYVRLLIGLSLLSFVPMALVAMTSFTRIVVTLSFLRHALGMPETPPNMVMMTLALFLTFFTMAPVLEQSYQEGVVPYLDSKIETAQALDRGLAPLKTFMTAHVRGEDLQAVSELARVPYTGDPLAVTFRVLVPSFMLSELRAAFTAGFIIFLPFLLIDLMVAAVLMALGMMMVPPVSISLPLKIMLFVLIDGWALLIRAIAGVYA